jgi:aspartyl-tRNA(Asn)/glutamyl-tRNA(Gln) amidotransferase subunit A
VRVVSPRPAEGKGGNSLNGLSAEELIRQYSARDLSPVEVATSLAERIQSLNPALNALTTPTVEEALEDARASERRYLEGTARPLEGVPVVVKDLLDTAGVRTTYGSSMFGRHVPAHDAAAVARIKASGAVLLGKAAMHEFAWGISTDNPHFGATRNPWALDRVPGGSSGGSAVALAAGMAPIALGTDTAGSIRIPASFCGVVGLKPTHSRVDAAGAFPLAPSLDHVGPMARTPADVMLLFSALVAGAGHAARSASAPADQTRGFRNLRVGVSNDLLSAMPLASDVRSAFEDAVRAVEDLGGRVVELPFPEARGAYDALAKTLLAEALFVHRRAGTYPARKGEYGEDVSARLRLAEGVTLDDYLVASEHRQRVRARFGRLFEEVDVLLSPVSAGPPSRIGEEVVDHLGGRVPFRELVITHTAPQSLAGLPACAVRAGFDDLGVPVGVQFTGPPWSEALVLDAAGSFYEATLAAVQAKTPDLTSVARPSP